jgi:MerR family redox-sensitive transcriptional activator SoxR
VIRVAQRLGIPLASIREALKALPKKKTAGGDDWQELSRIWRAELDERIRGLKALRDQLGRCIGCGCLSIKDCPLRNPWDKLSREGAGARLLEP